MKTLVYSFHCRISKALRQSILDYGEHFQIGFSFSIRELLDKGLRFDSLKDSYLESLRENEDLFSKLSWLEEKLNIL